MPVTGLTLASVMAPAVPIGTLDIALTDVQILNVAQESGWYEIEFGFTLENVGDVAYDLDGRTPVNDSDNAGIQTYLWNNNGGPFFAASGWSIYDAPTLSPGDLYNGTFTANTNQLTDPLSFGDNVWLVVDLTVPGEEPGQFSNNRRMALITGPILAQVPAPGPTGLAALGMLVTARRRR